MVATQIIGRRGKRGGGNTVRISLYRGVLPHEMYMEQTRTLRPRFSRHCTCIASSRCHWPMMLLRRQPLCLGPVSLN